MPGKRPVSVTVALLLGGRWVVASSGVQERAFEKSLNSGNPLAQVSELCDDAPEEAGESDADTEDGDDLGAHGSARAMRGQAYHAGRLPGGA